KIAAGEIASEPPGHITTVAQRATDDAMAAIEPVGPDAVAQRGLGRMLVRRDGAHRAGGADRHGDTVIADRAGAEVRAGAIAEGGEPWDIGQRRPAGAPGGGDGWQPLVAIDERRELVDVKTEGRQQRRVP